MTMFSQGPLRIGDELVFYYSSTSWGRSVLLPGMRVKGGGIFRARLRVDGFVSVSGGTLTTRPLAFEGDALFLNGRGPIRVAALNAEGQILAEADVAGDSLHHPVRFEGKSLRTLSPSGVDRDDSLSSATRSTIRSPYPCSLSCSLKSAYCGGIEFARSVKRGIHHPASDRNRCPKRPTIQASSRISNRCWRLMSAS